LLQGLLAYGPSRSTFKVDDPNFATLIALRPIPAQQIHPLEHKKRERTDCENRARLAQICLVKN